MAVPAREIPRKVRRWIYLRHSIGPIAVAIFFWALYAVKAAGHADLIALLHQRKADPDPTTELCLAIFGTIAAAVFGWVQIRKGLWLASKGLELTGVITGIGIPYKTLVKVACRLTFGGMAVVHQWTESKLPSPIRRGL
jgi:hypothetical protein